MIKYTCSDGSKVSQATINKRRSDTYKKVYEDGLIHACAGCGRMVQGTGHIVTQARCKQLHITEMIWNPINMLPVCHFCNLIMDNVSSEEFKKLDCYDRCLEILAIYDNEKYLKAINA